MCAAVNSLEESALSSSESIDDIDWESSTPGVANLVPREPDPPLGPDESPAGSFKK